MSYRGFPSPDPGGARLRKELEECRWTVLYWTSEGGPTTIYYRDREEAEAVAQILAGQATQEDFAFPIRFLAHPVDPVTIIAVEVRERK
jgi:hypothetical protein